LQPASGTRQPTGVDLLISSHPFSFSYETTLYYPHLLVFAAVQQLGWAQDFIILNPKNRPLAAATRSIIHWL
jgi:hypothetical protein